MDRNRKPCNCVRECPCFPRCDEMMEQQMPMQQPRSDWRMQPQMPYQPTPWVQPQLQPDMEMENEQDWERIKAMYPEMARMIQSRVEDACDRMEYEGSAMFDVMPDKTRVKAMAGEIQKMLEGQITAEQVEEQPELYTMNREPCRNCRPNQNFLGDFIEVMLYHEMFRRRCRHRNCRRW